MENVRYAKVHFEPGEQETQYHFLLAMGNVKIITISRAEIDEYYRMALWKNAAIDNRIILHDQTEEDLFRHVMKVFFPEKEYVITEKAS